MFLLVFLDHAEVKRGHKLGNLSKIEPNGLLLPGELSEHQHDKQINNSITCAPTPTLSRFVGAFG